MEAIKLSNQSSLRQLEAELASAKRDAAQAAASHKGATAGWVSDMDVLKAEVRQKVQMNFVSAIPTRDVRAHLTGLHNMLTCIFRKLIKKFLCRWAISNERLSALKPKGTEPVGT